MDEEEAFRMNHAGLVARSTEGHAAKGMKIKGQEDMWITIQHHTFRNWVNVQLRETGLRVEDLVEDMRDGLALVTLVEVLQKRNLKKVKRVMNQHQALENVTIALNAIEEDGIKLVNIGNVDIVNGNLKLILGLIWSLIMHYQIGQSKFPPKKLMLAWLKAVLPDCNISNFTSDWNTGVNLSALLDYCKPGTFKNWKNLNPDNAVENCRVAMDIASREFNVPILLEPEYLASVYLDDLSGMTYFSYFMKEGGPGYKATLEWAQKQLPEKKIQNFTTDWNDGLALTTLVKKLGGPVPGFKNLDNQPKNYVSNLQLGIDGGRKLGVEPVVSATDMSKKDCNHIGTMGYVAHYQWVQARKSPAEALAVQCDLDNVRVNNPVPFRIEFLEKDVVLSEIRVAVNGPGGPVRVDLDLGSRGGKGVFTPDEVGMYELLVFNEDELIDGCPVKVRALPDVTKAMFSGGIDPCAIGSIVEVEINSNNSGGGDVDVTAYSPTGRPLKCPVKCEDGVYSATFQPDEAGEWSIAVTYDDENIQGSPFNCFVYDPHALKVNGLDKGPTSLPGKPFTFVVDARECGWGEAKIDITQNGRSIHSRTLEIERGIYEVTFTPQEAARHKVYCYFNGHEVKGTPLSIYLGIEQPPERKKSKKKKKSSSQIDKSNAVEIVKEYSSRDLIKDSPKLSMSNDAPTLNGSSSLLNRTNESSLNRTNESSLNRTNESSLNRNYDSSVDRSYENTLFSSNKNYESSSSLKKTSSAYEAINNKYSNFESSSLNRRGSYLSNNNSSSKENLHELSPAKEDSPVRSLRRGSSALVPEDSPVRSLRRGSNALDAVDSPVRSLRRGSSALDPEDSPVRSLRRSSALDSSYNSSFNSSFNSTLNSSTSTVINTEVASTHKNSTSILNKSSINNNSLGRLSLAKSSTPSPPASVAHPKSPVARSISPTSQVPTALPGLSAAALVRQANQNAVKTEARRLRGLHDAAILRSPYISTIDEASDGGSDEISYRVSSEQRTSEIGQQKSVENSPDKSYNFSSERQTTTLSSRLSSDQRSPGLGRRIPSEHRSPEFDRRNPPESRTPELSRRIHSKFRSPEISQQLSSEQRSPLLQSEERLHTSTHSSTTNVSNLSTSELRTPELDRRIHSKFRSPEISQHLSSEQRSPLLQSEERLHTSTHSSTTNVSNLSTSEVRTPELGRRIHSKIRSPEISQHFSSEQRSPLLQSEERLHTSTHSSTTNVSNLSTTELRTPELSRRIHSKFRSPEISQQLSSEHRSPLLQSEEHLHTSTHSSTNVSNLATSNIISTSSLTTTTIKTEENQKSEELRSNSNTSERRSASSSAHTNSITNIPTHISTPTHSMDKRRLATNERSEGTYLSQSGSGTSIDLSGSSSHVLQHSRLASTMQPHTITHSNAHLSPHTNRSTQSFDNNQVKEGENTTYINESRTSVDVSDAVSHRLQASTHQHNIQGPPMDISRVSVSGPGVRLVSVNSRAEFTVNAPHTLRQEEVILKITGPGKRSVPCNTEVLPSGELDVWFTPPQVGEYLVDVRVQDQRVPGSPYRCYVYDSMEIRVGDIPNGIVGRPVEFEIDGSSAGSGNLEILVNGGHVTSYVRNLGQQRFLASFVPHSPIRHMVEMRFNGEKVPGSPWSVEVMEGGGARVAVLGDTIKHFPAGQLSAFDISAANVSKEDIQVHIVSPSKRPVSYQLNESSDGVYRVAFVTSEVGSYVVDVAVSGQKVQGSPFIAKAYDAGLIRVSDVPNGVVGQPCQFRVDASQAGEGQLEISINDGEVPNHVQVLGGGRCLVSFTPDTAKFHTIDIKFNGETVRGCPFVCRVADTSRVSLTLRHLELIPVGQSAAFNISVDGGGSAELTVTVRTPSQTTLPVRVSGSVRAGFTAEFTPVEVGAHTIIVNYNDSAVSGTPFTCKVYDAGKVVVSQLPRGDTPHLPGLAQLPRGAIGKSLQFIVDASEAGEGNLEISISAAGRNIPTQVHPQGSARFAVSFVPLEAIDHVINISFNKEPVQGSPFVAKVQADPNRIVVSGQSLAATAVDKTSFFTISNVTGTLEDVEVSVEGPSGQAVAAQVRDNGDQTFRVEFAPRAAGEHRIHVVYAGEPIPGSPFSCKVYDVAAIKVRPENRGTVGKPVTFLVETNNAGPGNLEVTVNNGQVPTSAQAQGNHIYAISFTPKEAKPHVVELKFNGENVPGSPFSCEVVDVSRVTVSGSGLEKVPVDRPATFVVDSQVGEDQLEVKVLSPSRQPLEPEVSRTDENKLQVQYVPTEVGDHSVEVRVAEMLVPGSPFLVKAYDHGKVRVTEVATGIVAKPVYFSIDASQAGAGNLEIIVSVNGRNVPNYVQSEGHARFRVNFKPKEAAVHTLSVKFNGEPVPGSPFKCRVSDSSQVVISGAGLKMSSLARPATITIDPRSADVSDCQVNITSPSGGRVPVNLTGNLPGKVSAEFQPTEVGPHTINVSMDGESVGGSPYTCNIYDVTKVQVTGLDDTKVNRPVTFTVDASQAGEGTLELVVTTAKASVRAEVAARSRGLYDVTFTPHEHIPHFVNITFNEEDVIGSPFKCDVRELEPREVRHLQRKESQMVTARGDGLKQVVTGTTASFTVDTKGLEGDLDIRVTGPDGGQVPARLIKLQSGLQRAEYQADQVGSYSVAILHQGSAISGTPYVAEAADPRRVTIQSAGECFSGQECALKVDASAAGRGSLSVGVRAVGQDVKHSIRDLGGGIYQVLFYPRAPIPHKVDVRYSGVPVKGGPFEIPVRNPATGHHVTATGVGLHQARVDKPTSFVIETLSQPTKDFDVLITGPGDWAVPVKCYQQKDGNLLAEYQPHAPGNYKIEVLCSTKHVKGSPFICTAYDASKVVLEHSKTVVAVGEPCIFKLDKTDAGDADLEAQVENASGVLTPLEVKSGPSGDLVEWTPDAPGQYRITMLYGGEEVPGSPLTVEVGESGLATVSGAGLEGGAIDTPLSFTVDGRGLLGEPHVTVDGPDSVARVNMRKQDEGLYQVTYVPHEVGIFDIRVKWNKRDVAGSPFHPKIVDPARVRLIGGWESLQDGQGRLELTPREEKRLTFDASEAGPGKLRAEVTHEGRPLNASCDHNGSRARVAFTPPSEGSYELRVWYSGLPLPHSPVRGWAEPVSAGDHTRVTLRGHGLTTARCGDQAEFIIDGASAGTGAPDVTMSGTKTDIPVNMTPEGKGVWQATYTPVLPGAYLLNVMWSDRQVRGCPLKVIVESVADASRVICSGEGLRHGVVGREIKSFIDTRNAGPGELTVTCAGPSKVALCDLDEHGDGTFTLNVRPQESGRHMLNVKYEGDHVPGSPFTLKVAGAPDPSKVRVYGPGIEHGVLASYQSRFICDTRGAGAGQLTVRIRGPKGAFRVEMQRESQKDRTILCKYDPTEPGDYRMEVKWSGENVPGSPFVVMIFDTQDELNRYMAGGYSPNGPGGTPSEYYGSIGYGTTYGAVSFGQMSWRGSQAQL